MKENIWYSAEDDIPAELIEYKLNVETKTDTSDVYKKLEKLKSLLSEINILMEQFKDSKINIEFITSEVTKKKKWYEVWK